MTEREPLMPARQHIEPRFSLGSGWVDLMVTTLDRIGQVESRTHIRTTKGPEPFVDLAIEEFGGLTKRAKFTSVRLDKEAARALYEVLAPKFSTSAADQP